MTPATTHRERKDDDEQQRAEERDLADDEQQREDDEDGDLGREQRQAEDDQLGDAHQAVDERVAEAARRDAARVVHLQQAGSVDAGGQREQPDQRGQQHQQAGASGERQQHAGDDEPTNMQPSMAMIARRLRRPATACSRLAKAMARRHRWRALGRGSMRHGISSLTVKARAVQQRVGSSHRR